MDIILSGMVESFSKLHGLTGLDQGVAFEHFTNYCVVSREHPERFKLQAVHVGGSGDLHIDGLAILVNDHIVSRSTDVDDLKRVLHRWEVTFLFIQAKRGRSFDTGEILKFLTGVRTFFEGSPPQGTADHIKELIAVKDHIYRHSASMTANPICKLFFATTGEWNEKGNASANRAVANAKSELMRTNLFSEVEFTPLDSTQLQQLYRAVSRRTERQIVFDKHTPLPKIAGVRQAYIGTLPCTEYLKLIVDDAGALDRRLFYDNVRDYLGDRNFVNSQIRDTIGGSDTNDRFVLLNNGVTIIAREVRQTGVELTLRDYQIVNGCQTSHVLYRSRDRLSPQAYLPVKLIVTEDVALTEQIIHGTNSQSELKPGAFAALATFHKGLEDFYKAVPSKQRLHYERRTRQYDDMAIPEEQIVSIDAQARTFVAMFLNEPHNAYLLLPTLIDTYKTKLFLDAHSPWPYYISALALSRMERLFRRALIPAQYEQFTYHLMMVLRLTVEEEKVPRLDNPAGIEKYCKRHSTRTRRPLSCFRNPYRLSMPCSRRWGSKCPMRYGSLILQRLFSRPLPQVAS